MPSPGRTLIVILGPTAVGKTSLAIALATALQGEILGADSRQIYRHMNIGTAKPTEEQLSRVRHHLIDIVDPNEWLALAQYQQMAYDRIDQLHLRETIPLLVGGTGQYITAVTEGWVIPHVPPNNALRNELEEEANRFGIDSLHARLRRLDPVAAKAIDPRNIRRMVRALEVVIESGIPLSQVRKKSPPPYRLIQLGLTMNREALYRQADERVELMMEMGLLNEVQQLLDMGYARSLPAMSGIGYAQLADHLLDGIPLAEAVRKIKHLTHDFIRRQYTWFRGHDQGILWHNVKEIEPERIVDDVCRRVHDQA